VIDDDAVLVVDAGSASLHVAVVDAAGAVVHTHDLAAPDELTDLVPRLPAVAAVGHRLVHGGPELTAPVLVDDAVRAGLATAARLAPLHVPPALDALDAAPAAARPARSGTGTASTPRWASPRWRDSR
jgi:acetate kinase